MATARPEPEVIVNFADGCGYSKTKLEALIRTGWFERPSSTPAKATKGNTPKKEDVELIVNEFDLSKAQAEALLIEHNNDIAQALKALLTV